MFSTPGSLLIYCGTLEKCLSFLICEMGIINKTAVRITCVTILVLLLFSWLSCVSLFHNPWTLALQGPLSIGFPRQEYWSRLPFPSPGGLPDPGIEPVSPITACGFFTTEPPGKNSICVPGTNKYY